MVPWPRGVGVRSLQRRGGDVSMDGLHGDPVLAEDLLCRPEHSMTEQGLRVEFGGLSTNGDGSGVGWYVIGSAPAAYESTQYKSTHPACSDEDLREVAGQLRAPLLFGHVRASTGTPVRRSNCHPCRYGRWSWRHDGSIASVEEGRHDLPVAVAASTVIVVTSTLRSTIGDHAHVETDLDLLGAARRLVTMSWIAVTCSVGMGTLLPLQIVLTILLRTWAFAALADHQRQRAAGADPTSSPDSSDLPARVPADAWT